MKRWIIMIFALACLSQWVAPVSMIWKRERTLRHGEVFLFKTAPVDPYDPYMGRYVALQFDLSSLTNMVDATNLIYGVSMIARLERDADGFATIPSIHDELEKGVPGIPVEIGYVYENTVNVNLPFDRFYLEENLAPEAERLYAQFGRSGSSNTFAVVRILEHFPVIEDLIINGRPVREYGPTP